MSSNQPTITTGRKERLSAFVSLYVPIFATDPVITYMLSSMPSQAARLAYLPDYFNTLLKAAALNGGTFDAIADSSGNYETASVLIPPGKRVDNAWTLLPAGFIVCLWKLGWGGCKRMLLEFEPLTARARSLALRSREPYFYVFFIGTRLDCRGRGLASDIIRHYQSRAQEMNVPIWLEATTAKSRDLYARLGFEVVQEIVLGRGRVGEDGLVVQRGEQKTLAEGVSVWGMVWRPEGYEWKG